MPSLRDILSFMGLARSPLSRTDREVRSRVARWWRYNIGAIEGREWAQSAEDMLGENALLDQVALYTQAALVDRPWRWRRRPGRDTDAALRNERHMNENWFGGLLERPWFIIAQQMARFLDIGWRVLEVDYGQRFDPHTGRWLVYVKDIHDIRPTDLGGWIWSTDKRRVEEMQLLNGATVPLRKCVHLRHRYQGDDPEGDLGRLYSCRRLHALFKLYEDLLGVGGEKWALQTPVVERNPEADKFYKPEQITAMIETAYTAAENYAAGEATVLAANPAVRLTTFGAQNGFDPAKLVDVCRWTSELSAGAYLASSLLLGQTQSGAKNVGELLEGALMTMLSQASKAMSAAVGDRRSGFRAVLRVLDLTFGDQDPRDYPELVAEGLEEAAIARVMNVLPNWLVSGAAAQDPEMYQLLRRLGGARTERPPTMQQGQQDVHLPNLDPSAGGLPAKVSNEEAGVSADDPDGEPDLPHVRPGNYVSSNRDVANLFGFTTGKVNSLVRRSVAAEVEVPAIGSGRDRRWDIDRVPGWYQALTGGSGSTQAEAA